MTVSIGLSTSTGQPNQSLENLMYTADKALYQAKHRGRNCVVSAQE
jgi:diguanylate cyclase (GGDEF)-like protein